MSAVLEQGRAAEPWRTHAALFPAVYIPESSDPSAELQHLFPAVILPWHNQGGQFHMASLYGFPDKGHDHLPVPAQHIPVIPVRESLQVNIHRVNERAELIQDSGFRASVRYHHIEHAALTDQLRGIPHIFPAYQRFIVGKRDSDIVPRP